MLPEIGKLDKATPDKIIFSRPGESDSSVLIGPRHGVDPSWRASCDALQRYNC